MKRAALILAALAAILSAAAAPVRTATETFVTNKIAEAVAAIPAPDMSAKQDALPYPTNAIPYDAIAGKPGGMTTNAVCDIVTKVVETAGAWKFSGDEIPPGARIVWAEYDENDNPYSNYTGMPLPYTVGWFALFANDTMMDVFSLPYAEDLNVLDLGMSSGDTGYAFYASRKAEKNALGLARLDDLPPLTNGLPERISAVAQAATNYTDAAIREHSLGGIWDESLQVWWTPRMRNGSLTYEATTNVNLNAEN